MLTVNKEDTENFSKNRRSLWFSLVEEWPRGSVSWEGRHKCPSISPLTLLLWSSFNSGFHYGLFRYTCTERDMALCLPVVLSWCLALSSLVPLAFAVWFHRMPAWVSLSGGKKLDRLYRGCTFANVVFQQPGELPRQKERFCRQI